MTTETTPAEEPPSDALLILRGTGRLPVGRGRIAMLQANAEIELQVTETSRIVAVITRHSADDLQLARGARSSRWSNPRSYCWGGPDLATHVSVRNRLDGTVVDRIDGGVNTEIDVNIGGGKTLTSVMTRHSADALGLRAGEPVAALFDAGHVIPHGRLNTARCWKSFKKSQDYDKKIAENRTATYSACTTLGPANFQNCLELFLFRANSSVTAMPVMPARTSTERA